MVNNWDPEAETLPYPAPNSVDFQASAGPAGGHSLSSPVSVDLPSRFGPPHCVHSDEAARSDEVKKGTMLNASNRCMYDIVSMWAQPICVFQPALEFCPTEFLRLKPPKFPLAHFARVWVEIGAPRFRPFWQRAICAQAIDAGLATWSDWVIGSVSTKHAPPLTSRSRRKSPPMLRLSRRQRLARF